MNVDVIAIWNEMLANAMTVFDSQTSHRKPHLLAHSLFHFMIHDGYTREIVVDYFYAQEASRAGTTDQAWLQQLSSALQQSPQ